MPHTVEKQIVVPEAGLTVIRGAIEPALAEEFEAECKQLLNEEIRTTADRERANSNPHFNVEQIKLDSGNIAVRGLAVSQKLLKNIGYGRGFKVVINHQKPKATQAWHIDSAVDVRINQDTPLVVFQASNDGEFQYSLSHSKDEQEVTRDAITIPVNAGDIIVQTNPLVLHRGANPSDHDRFNMVVFNPNSPDTLSLQDAIAESNQEQW